MNEVMKAVRFRHSCRAFQAGRAIPAEVLDEIVEAGRLAPSSLGMQPWHFLVAAKAELKAALAEACGNQPQIQGCSHFVVLLARKPHNYEAGSALMKEIFEAGKFPPERAAFVASRIEALQDKLGWAKCQTYLAGAQMMLAAAGFGVDGCPIAASNPSGEATAIARLVPGFPVADFEVAWNIAFGYRSGEQPVRFTLPREKTVTVI
ncbi:MAG: nitroreductase family protein [Treponema sp.]|nr:nitroreductase family protein [Treponema sp.]